VTDPAGTGGVGACVFNAYGTLLETALAASALAPEIGEAARLAWTSSFP
jgi:hypothetical protein